MNIIDIQDGDTVVAILYNEGEMPRVRIGKRLPCDTELKVNWLCEIRINSFKQALSYVGVFSKLANKMEDMEESEYA